MSNCGNRREAGHLNLQIEQLLYLRLSMSLFKLTDSLTKNAHLK